MPSGGALPTRATQGLCKRPGARGHGPATLDPRAGQSLTEFAIILPPILLLLLIAGNVGLAIRAHIAITEVTQQMAEHLVHNPSDASSAGLAAWASANQVSTSYPLTASEITVTVNAQTYTVGSASSVVQVDTVSVDYPFPLIAPFLRSVSFGALRSGAIHLGTLATTIAATSNAPTSVSVNPQASGTSSCTAPGVTGQHTVCWSAPSNSLGLTLAYCVYRTYTGVDGTTYTNQRVGCTSNTSFTDGIPSPAAQTDTSGKAVSLSYAVTAMQADGLESPKSTSVSGS